MYNEAYLIRENYLKKIRGFYHVDLIKVITGMRRSGKSVLLKQIAEELKLNDIDDDHIIFLNFELQENSHLLNSKALNNYIKDLIVDDQKYYLFFDEIQNVSKWENVVNSIRASQNVSIFITGSNSNLLSGELATHLSGRYVSFNVKPFTFSEVVRLKQLNDKEEINRVFQDYMLWGGMPQRFQFSSQEDTITYLEDLYNSIVYKDILLRNKVLHVDLLEHLLEYLVSTPSQTFSGLSISKYFQSVNRNIPLETLYNYFNYIINSFIINKVSRYDIRSKRILTREDKYYLTDLGLGHVKNINKRLEYGAYLENIVYNELVYRGYTVYVGKFNQLECDFVATKTDQKIYIQVAYLLADQQVIDREFEVLKKLSDNYPKYVLSMDLFDFSQEGIIHKNIVDWLLETDY